MSKLRKATIDDFRNTVPGEDLKNIDKTYRSSGFALNKKAPLRKRDDSLIELEIAFRKCKRVGVFD